MQPVGAGKRHHRKILIPQRHRNDLGKTAGNSDRNIDVVRNDGTNPARNLGHLRNRNFIANLLGSMHRRHALMTARQRNRRVIRLDHFHANVANRLCQPAVVTGDPRAQDRMPAAKLQRGMNLRNSFFHPQLHIVCYHDFIPPKKFFDLTPDGQPTIPPASCPTVYSPESSERRRPAAPPASPARNRAPFPRSPSSAPESTGRTRCL